MNSNEPVYFVWDVESTGVDVFTDRIVQLFAATAREDGTLVDTWEFFIDPGVPIPEEASKVHGFTNEYLRDVGDSPENALREVRELFLRHRKLTQVCYNMNYDLSILDQEMKRHGVSDTLGDWIECNARLLDGIVIDRHKDPYRKGKRTLSSQADHYGVPYSSEDLHNARADVELTARVTAAIVKRYGSPTTKEQKAWREKWRVGFEKYLQRSDPQAKVEKGWPRREEDPL